MLNASIVRNTDDHVSSYDKQKIISSIFEEINFVSDAICNKSIITLPEASTIADKVEDAITALNSPYLSGSFIRELVCNELMKFDIERGSKDFLLHKYYKRIGLPLSEAVKIVTGTSDKSTENANQSPNPETTHKKIADAASKEAALLMLPHHIADAHLCGDIHIHDREYFLSRTFCMDHDLRFWFYYGLDPDCTGRTNIASAAQHPEVAILHASKILGSAQTNFSGGQGFYNFLTFLSPYFKDLPYHRIKQLMQMFIYEIAQTMCARGAQVVFSSVQLSPGIPKIWKDIPAVYKGIIHNGEHGEELVTYGSFEKEVRLMFRAFMEVMLAGDAWGKPFNFPKPEIAIEEEYRLPHDQDIMYLERDAMLIKITSEFHPKYDEVKLKREYDNIPMTYHELYGLTLQLAAKFGTPYYDNMIPQYRQTDGISCYQCCAYSFGSGPETSSNFEEKLRFIDGQHFSMGGVGVVTLNSPRAAYNSEPGNFESLMIETERILDLAVEVMLFKKSLMKRLWDKNKVPFATQRLTHPKTKELSPPLVDFEELVYIIGVLGINEVAEHFTGQGMDKTEGFNFAIRYVNHLKNLVNNKAKEHDIKLVLARTPAETTCQRFAVLDLIHYPEQATPHIKGDLPTALKDIAHSRNLPIYYSNGTHLPVDTDVNIIERIDIEETFFPILDGGNIFHIWMGEGSANTEGLHELFDRIVENSFLGYFAFTVNFSICNDCKKQYQGMDKCPECDSENILSYSRVTGYIQAIEGWNKGKLDELKSRKNLN